MPCLANFSLRTSNFELHIMFFFSQIKLTFFSCYEEKSAAGEENRKTSSQLKGEIFFSQQQGRIGERTERTSGRTVST